MPLIMFRVNQDVKVLKDKDGKIVNRQGVVILVNDDGTGRIELRDKKGTVIDGVWPEDCEPD